MIIRELRRRALQFIAPSLAICLVAYFVYHLIQGGRGLLALRDLEQSLAGYHKRIAELKEKHDRMIQKVRLLRSESLCTDLLEERAKAVLGYAHKNEQVVLQEELQKK